jgi:ankyrin repeat protein
VNLTNTKGDTLVMLASYYGHESTVAALIARGADVDRHNNRGQTPLTGAVFKNDTTIIELLLSADADPLAGSPSALETARFFGKEQLARQLLQHIQRAATRCAAMQLRETNTAAGAERRLPFSQFAVGKGTGQSRGLTVGRGLPAAYQSAIRRDGM